MPDIQSLIGKEVEVIANGVSYRGTLVEVSDTDVHLKTSMQWISLPVASVGEVRPAAVIRTGTADAIAEPEEIRDRHIPELLDDAGN